MDCIRHKCISNEFIMPDTEYTLNKIVNGDARESKRFCNDKKRITKIPIVNANVISFLFEVFDFFSNEYYTDIVKNHTKNLKHAKYIENNGKHKKSPFHFCDYNISQKIPTVNQLLTYNRLDMLLGAPSISR